MRFGGEFAQYIDSFVYTLRHQSGIAVRETGSKRGAGGGTSSAKGSEKKGKALSASERSRTDSSEQAGRAELLIFSDMKNLVDLLALYADVNQTLLQDGQERGELFRRVSKALADIKEVLRQTPVQLDSKDVKQLREKNKVAKELFTGNVVSVWTYF